MKSKLQTRLWLLAILFLCHIFPLQVLAQLKIDPEKISLGKVISGTVAEGHFTITNLGSHPLHIDEILSYCGCTIVDFSPQELQPNKSLEIQFTLDTHELSGRVIRQITVNSNDSLRPSVDVEVTVFALSESHKAIDGKSPFDEGCIRCHGNVAFDDMGEPLFQKVCASCHGNYGLGGLAPTINDFDYVTAHQPNYFRNIIKFGVDQSAMPGFHALAGGPLSDRQIESLVELMIWWREGYILKKGEQQNNR